MNYPIMIVTSIFASQAVADCGQDLQTFASCHIEGRDTEVSVCFDDRIATYSYGPVGQPAELTLSEPVKTIDFRPWSGVTSAIGESVTFGNGDYSYTLVGGFERPELDPENPDADAEPRHYGWIEVKRRGENLVRMECVPETVNYAFGGGIYDLKIAAGLTWNARSREWLAK